MKARYYILAIAIIGFFIVLSLPNYQITIEKVNNKLISFVSGAVEPWTIEGDSVYIDDVNILLNITPHTSNQPIIKLMTKAYSGEIDVVVGFDTDKVTPKKAEYNPQLLDVEKSYTCNYEFNYTANPNYFWCYQTILTYDNITNETNGSYTNVVFEHSFLTGDIPTQTAYWTEVEEVWTDVSGAFTSANVDYLGYNKWYYIQGFNISALQEYQLRLTLQPNSINEPSYKYFFGVKPSSETLQEAIANGHFYYIDPWTEGLNVDISGYYKLDEQDTSGSGTIIDSLENNNLTNNGASNVTGKINTAYSFDGTNDYIGGTQTIFGYDQNVSFHAWVNVGTIVAGDYGIILGGDQNGELTLNLRVTGTNHFALGLLEWGVAWKGDAVGAKTISTGNWYSVTGTYAGAGNKALTLYVDGAFDGSSTGTSSVSTGSLIAIGGGFGSGFLDADIDEVGIWHRILNTTEIVQLNESISWEETVGVSDCKFNGTVKDGDGNAINGARIVINYAESDSFFGNATSDASGLWNLNVTADGNFTVYAYEPSNITRPGDIKSYVECIRV